MYISFIPCASVAAESLDGLSVSASIESNALIDGLTDVSMSLPSLPPSSTTPTQQATPIQATTPTQQATPTQLVTPTDLMRSLENSMDSAHQSASPRQSSSGSLSGSADPNPSNQLSMSVLLTPDAFSSSTTK